MNNQFTIRPAKPEEAGLVLEFIKKLAVYEKCADEVVADEARSSDSLCFSTTSPLLSGARACISKTCSSFPKNAVGVTAKLC